MHTAGHPNDGVQTESDNRNPKINSSSVQTDSIHYDKHDSNNNPGQSAFDDLPNDVYMRTSKTLLQKLT